MVDMDVSDDERPHPRNREIDSRMTAIAAAARRFIALKQPTIDQHAVLCVQHEFVTGARNAIDGTVVNYLR
jgi:hypothetical protein